MPKVTKEEWIEAFQQATKTFDCLAIKFYDPADDGPEIEILRQPASVKSMLYPTEGIIVDPW